MALPEGELSRRKRPDKEAIAGGSPKEHKASESVLGPPLSSRASPVVREPLDHAAGSLQAAHTPPQTHRSEKGVWGATGV